MKPFAVSLRRFLLAAAFVVAVSLIRPALAAPPEGVLDHTHAAVRAVMELQAQVTPALLAEGMLGTAVGLDENDQPALIVYVDRDGPSAAEAAQAHSGSVHGIKVKVELTDKFRAMRGNAPAKGGGGGVSHTAKQTPPIQLGTSGGWSLDLANGYCCGGTLGSLVQVNGVQYILSNYHVFESDIVPGGNGNVAATGDPIIQPGLIDVSCNVNNAQSVGTLVKVSSLSDNNVDCSVAQVVSGMVRTDGAILEIGAISSQTVAAALKQAVKKSGRTSGLTSSTVSGLNANVSVTYDNECAGGAAFTKTFTGQIIISNRGGFLKAGDSGSLMVQNAATNPKAVGLLFAGSSTLAVANPIGDVLTFLGGTLGGTATMVGQ